MRCFIKCVSVTFLIWLSLLNVSYAETKGDTLKKIFSSGVVATGVGIFAGNADLIVSGVGLSSTAGFSAKQPKAIAIQLNNDIQEEQLTGSRSLLLNEVISNIKSLKSDISDEEAIDLIATYNQNFLDSYSSEILK